MKLKTKYFNTCTLQDQSYNSLTCRYIQNINHTVEWHTNYFFLQNRMIYYKFLISNQAEPWTVNTVNRRLSPWYAVMIFFISSSLSSQYPRLFVRRYVNRRLVLLINWSTDTTAADFWEILQLLAMCKHTLVDARLSRNFAEVFMKLLNNANFVTRSSRLLNEVTHWFPTSYCKASFICSCSNCALLLNIIKDNSLLIFSFLLPRSLLSKIHKRHPHILPMELTIISSSFWGLAWCHLVMRRRPETHRQSARPWPTTLNSLTSEYILFCFHSVEYKGEALILDLIHSRTMMRNIFVFFCVYNNLAHTHGWTSQSDFGLKGRQGKM